VRSPIALAAVASTAALFAAGCGGSSYSSGGTSTGSSTKSASATNSSAYPETKSTSAAASTTGSTSTAASTGVVVVSKHSHDDGTILAAGPKRLTVYLFEGDHGSTSACTGTCAQVWPPVTTAAAATAASGAVTADLGTITRSDGTTQVTYKGHPLYFYAKDKDDGDAYGQGVHGFGADWYVLKPSGAKVDNS
jgi:predicted lipoprotein with Yx(FWY)xxD motif